MKPHRWAVLLHDFVLNPKRWMFILPAIVVSTWFATGNAAIGVLTGIVSPIVFVGALLIYWLAAATKGPVQLLGLSVGMGAFMVVTKAFEEGVSPNDAQAMFAAIIGLILILKAIAVYVAPIWAERSSRD